MCPPRLLGGAEWAPSTQFHTTSGRKRWKLVTVLFAQLVAGSVPFTEAGTRGHETGRRRFINS